MQSNKPIAAIGFGELGSQIEILLEQGLNRKISHFFDDTLFVKGILNCSPFKEFKENIGEYDFIVCLGYNNLNLKSQILHELKMFNAIFKSIIHESVSVSESAIIEDSVVIYPGSVIDKMVTIKMGCIINNGVIISHNSVVSESCYLSPGVVLSGEVRVEKNTFIGAGSIVSNGIQIGENCRIGIGSVITKDIPSNTSVIGNPMRILSNKLSLN